MSFFKTMLSFLRDEEYREILITSIVVLLIGTIAYHYLEGWSWFDSLYFSMITLTTIGYGDFSPQTFGGKLFTLLYIIIGLGMILSFFHMLYNHFSEEMKITKKNQENSGKDIKTLK